MLHIIPRKALTEIDLTNQHEAISALEAGQMVYFPHYAFTLTDEEQQLFQASILTAKRKNISYMSKHKVLSGVSQDNPFFEMIQTMMHRYALYTESMVEALLPQYHSHLLWGRTSYRPAQIHGRATSKRKDDTRLHVDAFPSTPVHGMRIFRIFCNINPHGEPRVWQVGEPFNKVMETFSAQLPRYSHLRARLLHWLKITKTKRSAYDHYMLHLHDSMKQDDHYQQVISKQQLDFPPQTTWMVFTDQVSHAALSGQYVLEQTFYIPINAMNTPSTSPLHQWQQTGLVQTSP